MSERLRLRSIRLDERLWERVTLAASKEGRSAGQLMAALARAYVEGGASSAQEPPGTPPPSPDPRQARSVAPGPALLPFWPAGAGGAPQPLNRPDTCSHPAAARRGGVRVVRHCVDCGQPFGLTGIAG